MPSVVFTKNGNIAYIQLCKAGVPQNGRKSFPGDVARFEFEPEGDVIDKFVLKKERFEKPYSLE